MNREHGRNRERGAASGVGTLLRVIVALAISAVIVPPVAGAVAGLTLLRAPLPGDLPDERPQIEAIPSTVFDRSGNEIAVFRGFDRTVEVDIDDIPEIMNLAVVAIEDQRFYEHNGVDLEGVARAAQVNLELGEIVQGGSTITQQYIKNVYLTGDRTFERKFREALLAAELEEQLSKDEILFRYLETSYFGSGAYGIGAAAEVYFAKPVSELDISEAATLAGILQAPSRLSPRVDIEASDDRRLLVLQAMLDQDIITIDEHAREAARTLWSATDPNHPGGTVTLVAPPPPNGALDHPYFVDWIEAQLVEDLGPDLLYRGGLEIHTTIDPALQRAAERAVAARLEGTEYPVEMSLVSLEPVTGHVVAMVGGRDHDASQVNLATGGTTGFQPGSSFKPIVLAEAFSQGIGPDTIYPAPAEWIVPGCTGSQCTLSNYDFADRGEITLREATRASVNTVFAELITDVSIERTVALAQALGLERLDSSVDYGPSLALGSAETSTLEMASAYGTFANLGVRVAPIGVLRVIDPKGNVLIDRIASAGTQVLDAAVAANVTDVLVDVVTDGTGTRAAVSGHPIAGKTGTGQEYRAAWFVGYTPTLATAVWMGHADGLASLRNINGVPRVTGGSHPAIAFSDFMTAALVGVSPQAFPPPPELVQFATSDEVVAVLEENGPGVRGAVDVIDPDCDGTCRVDGVPDPTLDPPAPTTVPPTTTTPSTTAPSSTDPAGPTVPAPPTSVGQTTNSSTTRPSSTTSTTEKSGG